MLRTPDTRSMAANTETQPAAPARRWWDPGWSWKVWVMVAAMLIPTLGFAFWVLYEAGGQTKIDPETYALASANAAGPVTAITGTEHTVYHANNALPSADSPRSDGAYTLVWFTSTSCARCDQTSFAHSTMAAYRGDVVFVEKAADRESADDRLGIEELPAFVWLDAEGNELGRPAPFADEAALRAEVERMLASR